MTTPGKSVALALLLLDSIAVIVVFNLVAYAHGVAAFSYPIIQPLMLPLLAHNFGIYLIDGYNSRTDMMSLTYASLHVIALLGVLAVTLMLTYAVIPPGFTLQSSRFVMTFSYLALIPVTLFYRRGLYARALQRRRQRYFLFLGSPENCISFKEDCRKNNMTQAVLYATPETFALTPVPVATEVSIPPFGDAANYLDRYAGEIDAIILRESNRELPDDVAQKLIDLQFTGVPTYTLELFTQVYWRKIPLYRLNQIWLFQEGFQIAREPVFERLKRVSDIALALLGLLLFAPFFPLIAAAIWLGDRGPVFFQQVRVGRNRVSFSAWKLRTMRVSGEGAAYTQPNDQRITGVGRLLRATRLDEVPQLWNVLCGDMSLIGPRAEWIRLVEEYERKIPCYNFRHLVKPGITGWAQVNYPYGASVEDTLHKLEYDLYYIRHFSFVLDASIVLKTVQVMLFGKGR
jgi:exopolysaccharide biosynthesis polyprenyl glycosylphosphotransferase